MHVVVQADPCPCLWPVLLLRNARQGVDEQKKMELLLTLLFCGKGSWGLLLYFFQRWRSGAWTMEESWSPAAGEERR